MDTPKAPAGAGSFLAWRQHHALPPGTPCRNCATGLVGAWCHACGQAGEDFHRHAHHLLIEALEGLFHADGRLFGTMPRLAADPDGLTRDYLAGRRASQIPPMRLFLVTLFIVFLVGGWVAPDASFRHDRPPAEVKAELAKAKANVGDAAPVIRDTVGWILDRTQIAAEDPERLLFLMREKAHDFAFLMLPLSALILSAMFVFRRGFLLFDHLVFSMHSLAFQGLLASAALALNQVTGGAWLLLLGSPVHLFIHMRGVYGTSVAGTLLRMSVLFWATLFGFLLLLAGLVLVGLQGLRA
jgi:hypothetical protein